MLPIEVVSCGFPFFFVPLKTLEAARSIRFTARRLGEKPARARHQRGLLFTKETELQDRPSTRDVRSRRRDLEDPRDGRTREGRRGCTSSAIKFPRSRGSVHERQGRGWADEHHQIVIEQEAGEISGVRVGGGAFYGEGYLEDKG